MTDGSYPEWAPCNFIVTSSTARQLSGSSANGSHPLSFKAQACFDDHTPRPATRRPHLGCARPSDDKQIMLSILRDHVPSLRVLLKTPLHGSCSLSIVERCANTCTADTVRGPALRGRRAYPATRDAGERPRCTPQPPLCMFRRRMVPCSNSLTCLESAQPCSGTTRHQRKL